jgi:hypothetical protein
MARIHRIYSREDGNLAAEPLGPYPEILSMRDWGLTFQIKLSTL